MMAKRIIALILAFILSMANPLTVFAENAPLSVSVNEIPEVEDTDTENSLEVSEEEEVICEEADRVEKTDEKATETDETVSENSASSNGIELPKTESGIQFSTTTTSTFFPEDTWEYGVATEYAGGKGTEEDPYQIANAAQLALFAHNVNGDEDHWAKYRYYKLTSSITLNDDLENPTNVWPGVKSLLSGNFDGNGMTISNIYINTDNYSCTSFICGAAEISDLTIDGIKIVYTGTFSDARFGGIAQSATKMEGCQVKGDFIADRPNGGTAEVGGLIWRVNGEMSDCSSSVNIRINNAQYVQASGLVHENAGTISNCWFDGSLELDASGEGNSQYHYGCGIVYENEASGIIDSCFTTDTAKISGYCVGGIVYTSEGEIDNCTNNAELTGNLAVAGIVKTVRNGSVEWCTNKGLLNCTNVSEYAKANVSGIASELMTYSGENYTITVSGCTNKADITGNMGNGEKITYVSGIVYDIYRLGGRIDVINCVNEGKLEGKTVAGILGRSEKNAYNCYIKECENKGDLIATETVGGIIAEAGETNSYYVGEIYVSQCMNRGSIQGNDSAYVGGIAGLICRADIDSCYNIGTITAKNVGGIVGSVETVSDATCSITRSYNLGVLCGEDIGGIVRVLESGTVSSCYNMGKLTQIIAGGYNEYSDSVGVGGVVNCISPGNNSITLKDCFNCGVIEVGSLYADVGGIASEVWSAYWESDIIKLANCYSIGTIHIPEGKEAGTNVSDGISSLNSKGGSLILENIYFLDSEIRNYSSADDVINVEELHPCTQEQLKQVSTYSGFDFDNTWKKGGRKYPFPMLVGVGEKYLEYDFAGVGNETVFSEYIIQLKEKTDKDTFYSRGIPNAIVSFQGNSYRTDKNGMIRFLVANKDIGEVVATHDNFYEEKVSVVLRPNEIFVMELERKIDIKPPRMNISEEVDIEGGSVETDEVSFSAIDFPFSIELKVNYSRKGDNKEAIPFQMEIDRDKQEVKISYGMKFKDEDTDYYTLTKETFWKCREEKSSKDAIDFLRETGTKVTSREWGGSLDFYYMGYITLHWTDKGYQVKESQGLIGFSGSSEVTTRYAATGGIVYTKLELKLSADGTYTLEFDEELEKIISRYDMDLEQALTVAAGAGCDLAKIEVGAEGAFKEKFVLDGYFDVDEDLTIEFTANPYVEGKLWIFSVKKELKLWDGAQLWPEQKLIDPTENVVATLQEFGDAAEYEMLGRDYLNENATVPALLSMVGDSGINRNVSTISASGADVLHQDSVYPDAWTSLCELSDGTKIATWIADAGMERADADRTVLCYSVADSEGNFGEAKAVYDSGRGDYYPVLLAKGNSAYVAWVNADKKYGNTETTVEDISVNNSIYISAFDRSTNTFGEPVRITENRGKMPLYLKLASDGKEVTVTWSENSDNKIYMSSGTNTIYCRELKAGVLSDTKTLVDGLDYLYDMDANYVNGSYALVWNQDTDGDLTTTADSEVFCLQNGTKTQLTSNSQPEEALVLTCEDLYFIKEGMICRMPELDSNLLENTGIVCGSDFKVLEGKLGTALLWFVKDGFVSMPMVSYEQGNVFTDAVVLKDMGDVSVDSYGALYEEDGSITLFVEECDVDTEWEMNWEEDTSNQSPFGNTNLRYYSSMIPADLIVDDYLYYAQELTAPGAELTFKTDVYNNSDKEISELTLLLKKDGNEVAKASVATALSAGASQEVEMQYTLPSDFTAGTYTLMVTVDELEENNTANNTASAEVGYANLVLKDVEVNRNEDGSADITGTIKNEGYQAVNNATSTVQMLNGDGEVGEDGLAARTTIFEESNIGLGIGGERVFSTTVAAEDIVFDNAYDSKVFLISVNSNANEILYTDNEETLLLNPVKAENMDLGEDAVLTLGSTMVLTPVIAPVGAYAECIYTSSDLSVAMVGTDGTVTALGEGTATIMAVTADGEVTDSVTITVEAEKTEEAAVDYYLDSETLTIGMGEKVDLSLLWEDMTEDGTGIPEQRNFNWTCSDFDTVGVLSGLPSGGNEPTEVGETLVTATLTGLKAGSAVVTVTIADSITLSCVVQITDNRVKTVSFEESETVIEKGNTLQLSLSTNPAGADTNEFTFTSSDETVATVDDTGLVTALSVGEATIKAVYNNTLEGEEEVDAFCQVSVTDITQEKFSLRFDSNGGSNIPEEKASQFVLYGDSFVFPEEVTRPGYYFAGWNTAIDGSGDSYNGSENIMAGSIADGTVLYAQWVSQEMGMWIADVEEQVYTGKAIKPEVAVYDGTKLLTAGVDYTLSYKNNIKPGDASEGNQAPTVTVRGKGNYTGSQMITFTILPIDLGSVEGIAADDIIVKANGKVQKPSPMVTLNGKKLAKGTDYILEYPDMEENAGAYKEAGEYRILIKGKGGYTGVREVGLTITNSQLMSKTAISRIANQPYTGEAITPAFTVKYDGKILKEKVGNEEGDYTVAYRNNVAAGTATMILTGTGTDADGDGVSYMGSKSVTFKIVGVSLGKVKVSGVPTSVEYTGEAITVDDFAQEPVLQVTAGEVATELAEGTDYTISYAKNTGKGTASIIFTGINGYTGTIKKNFKINPYNLATNNGEKVDISLAASVPYAKGGSKPEPVVTFDGKTLKKGSDYILSYQNVSKVHDGTGTGIPTVIIKGKGCYTGSIKSTFAIEKQDLSNLKIKASDQVFRNKKNAYKTSVSITDLDGKTLKAGTDYERTYTFSYVEDTTLADGTVRTANEVVGSSDIVPVGTKLYVIVDGKGNYQGVLKAEYRIVELDVSKAKVTVEAQKYTGSAICPGKDEIKVTYGDMVLTEDDYDITGYSNNINKGTAKLTIKGKGNYGGTKTVSFKIKSKSILWWWDNLLNETVQVSAVNVEEKSNGGSGKGLTFSITSAPRSENTAISEDTVVIDDKNVNGAEPVIITENGQTIEPGQDYEGLVKDEIIVKLGDTVLDPDDYEIVSYQKDADSGSAKLTIRGTGEYGIVKTVGIIIRSKLLEWWENILNMLFGE